MLFWELFKVLSWFGGTILQEKEEVIRFTFQQLILEVFLNITGPETFENNYLWMILDTNFLKNMSFRSANSLWKLLHLEQIEKISEDQNINHAKFVCSW